MQLMIQPLAFHKDNGISPRLYCTLLIRDHAANRQLSQLLVDFAAEGRRLNKIHIAAALHGAAKAGERLGSDALSYLAAEIGSCDDFNAQAIGNALFGLKEHRSSPATEAVLSALARKIGESPAQLDAQHVGNALFGLNEHGSSPGTEAVLHGCKKMLI